MGKPRKGAIRKPKRPSDSRYLRFSFQYLQLEYPKFHIDKCLPEFFHPLIKTLVRYSKFTIDEFKEPNAPYEDHRHKLNFAVTTERAGFPGIKNETTTLWTDEAWQFALCAPPGSPWRVHGFIEADIFFVVWLDAEHLLDP